MPYERNGLQVAQTFAMQDFFAERIGGMAAGIPTNPLPHASMVEFTKGRIVTYVLGAHVEQRN